jgi:hypothetical protein
MSKVAAHILPKPDSPYPDWSRLLKAVWMHGMSVHNIDPRLVGEHVERASGSVIEAMTRRNEVQRVRPSAFLACARQTYYAVQGETAGPMPDNIGPTFAVGHMLHELSYAAIKSALPVGFKAETEKEVSLPDWWPDDFNRFNQQGHVDMLITALDPEGYLPKDAPEVMLVDFKTMGGFSYKKHGKTIWGEDPDAFGYLAQLAVYADALGVLESGALIAGINRDSLTQPLLPRYIEPKVLKEEARRVQAAIEMALAGDDPGEEFLVRHDRDAYFQCGRGGRAGYCAFRDICRDNPTRDGAD